MSFRMPTDYPNLGPDGEPGGPYYWMHEQTGVLRAAMAAYLHGQETPEQLALVIAYCAYWVRAPVWKGLPVELRARPDHITTREGLEDWLTDALGYGIDPL
jgi:hypothetical protein